MCTLGALMCVLFADPACAVLNEVADRIKLKVFWVSLLVAPLASNMSELAASYRYGCKKMASGANVGVATVLAAT